MKSLTICSLMAAAALTALANGASAQTLNAEIPFSFQAGRAAMGPGAYTVRLIQGAGSSYFTLRNEDTRQSVILTRSVQENAPKKWLADGKARLGFDCVEARCVLRQVWSGGSSLAYAVPAPKSRETEAARITEVVLTKAN
jgi:hypothetical protein